MCVGHHNLSLTISTTLQAMGCQTTALSLTVSSSNKDDHLVKSSTLTNDFPLPFSHHRHCCPALCSPDWRGNGLWCVFCWWSQHNNDWWAKEGLQDKLKRTLQIPTPSHYHMIKPYPFSNLCTKKRSVFQYQQSSFAVQVCMYVCMYVYMYVCMCVWHHLHIFL